MTNSFTILKSTYYNNFKISLRISMYWIFFDILIFNLKEEKLTRNTDK